MGKGHIKKGIAITLSACLAFSGILTGCKNSSEKASTEGDSSGKLSPKPITYTWLISEHNNVALKNDSPIFKALEEKTNVKIEFMPVPGASYKEKYNIMLNSNSLPDLVWSIDGDASVSGPQGAFLKLNDLIDKYAPNMKKNVLNDEYKNRLASYDGGIYLIPVFNTDKTKRLTYSWHYREDMANELGIKEPQTLDEWYAAFKKVKAAHPDIIPFSLRKEDWKWEQIFSSFNAASGDRGMVINPKTGVAEYAPLTDRSKALIGWMAKLYKEGLLDKEFFTNTSKDFQQKADSGKVFAFAGEWYSVGLDTMKRAKAAGNNTMRMTVAAPPMSEFGQDAPSSPIINKSNNVAFNRKIKNPEIAMKFIDYLGFTAEGIATLNYGVEGENWNMESYGPDYLNEEINTIMNSYERSWTLGYNDRIPCMSLATLYPQTGIKLREAASKNELEKLRYDFQDKIVKYIPDQDKPTVEAYLDKEKQQILKEKVAIVDPMWNEFRTKCIIGQESLDNWDKFVAQMKENGVDEIVKIYSEAYEKYKASK